jgi:diaminohydroxyphosphoribosylaminopyrimidine deaminase/5-amino-6-(5-phosphoribosylamino)uracil reductase
VATATAVDATTVGDDAPVARQPRDDRTAMLAALDTAIPARRIASPNPWVGVVILSADGEVVARGTTEAPGGRHAEVVALEAAGPAAAGGTLVTTLEPCVHTGRTPPCTEAIVEAGVRRLVVGVPDPDDRVAGRGLAALRNAGLEVVVGVCEEQVGRQLAPYLHHRRTGRPFVVCKLAATLDGATAAPDGSSRWITGLEARRDAHRLRAESDAVLVGAGTVLADDPQLTVRHVAGPDPRRVVLGRVPATAKIRPCLEWDGPITDLLDELGRQGVLQLLVEGGAAVAGALHALRLVDRYVLYFAPALLGGSGGHPVLDGAPAPTIEAVWRGRLVGVTTLGEDLRVELEPHRG